MTARSTALRFALLALAALLLAQPVAAAWSGWSEPPGGGSTDVALSATLSTTRSTFSAKAPGTKRSTSPAATPPAAAGAAGPRFPAAG